MHKTLVPLLLVVSLIASGQSRAEDATTAVHAEECVVLLHGLARSSYSMAKMETALLSAGYRTANVDYPSRSHRIQDLARYIGEQGVGACRKQVDSRIHFVTHSMGGILVRYYLAANSLDGLGRVVMLAPPNRGSLLTDQLRDEAWYKWLTGPAGQQLGTGPDGIPGMLGAVDYPVGVIAGNVHSPVDKWLAQMIPGTDDGNVGFVRHYGTNNTFATAPGPSINVSNHRPPAGSGASTIHGSRRTRPSCSQTMASRKFAGE